MGSSFRRVCREPSVAASSSALDDPADLPDEALRSRIFERDHGQSVPVAMLALHRLSMPTRSRCCGDASDRFDLDERIGRSE